MAHFSASQKKLERADKHIYDLYMLFGEVSRSDNYTIGTEMDTEQFNWLSFRFKPGAFPTEDAALILGDALHNLRSSLDILWHEIMAKCGGTPTDFSRFPIHKTRDGLIIILNSCLKKKQISSTVHEFVLDTIQPYRSGNYALWALHNLNMRDKHQLIIPTLGVAWSVGVTLEDDKGTIEALPVLHSDGPWRIRLPIEFRTRKFTVKSKGQTSFTVLFQNGFPFEGKLVSVALNRVFEEVSRTNEAFRELFG